jgi:hypothetical protein
VFTATLPVDVRACARAHTFTCVTRVCSGHLSSVAPGAGAKRGSTSGGCLPFRKAPRTELTQDDCWRSGWCRLDKTGVVVRLVVETGPRDSTVSAPQTLATFDLTDPTARLCIPRVNSPSQRSDHRCGLV